MKKPVNQHNLEPDFNRPLFEVPIDIKRKIINILTLLYGSEVSRRIYPELERIMKVYYAYKCDDLIEWEKSFDKSEMFGQEDVILITYGDIIQNNSKKPLKVLADFCRDYFSNSFNTIHILPFFPYSSDRGFSVKDFEEVDHNLGTWSDIEDIGKDFKLMFDGVFNHISAKSKWFQEFLNGNPDFKNFFIVLSTSEMVSEDHLKLIVRPRTSSLFTEFQTIEGPKLVWTTFSPDQVDLNFHNPKVLIKMIDIFLTYVRRGADMIRLDAVTYLWEELGTDCVHLKQTHAIIKLFRVILDAVAPYVALITETNVPHEQNIQYFGNGYDEAQMVYNFALPPLVYHSFVTGKTNKLTKWAKTIKRISEQATYFNFLDSHDGIGLLPVKGILDNDDIEFLVYKTVERGGYISYRTDSDGSESPYELNITWYSAINGSDDETGEDQTIRVKRYIASRAIALFFLGVPGIYFHGLIGSKNDAEAVLKEKNTRSINREVIDGHTLREKLEDKDSISAQIVDNLNELINIRKNEALFQPNARQYVYEISEKLFAFVRKLDESDEFVLCIINVTRERVLFEIPDELTGKTKLFYELVSKRNINLGKNSKIEIGGYGIMLIKSSKKPA